MKSVNADEIGVFWSNMVTSIGDEGKADKAIGVAILIGWDRSSSILSGNANPVGDFGADKADGMCRSISLTRPFSLGITNFTLQLHSRSLTATYGSQVHTSAAGSLLRWSDTIQLYITLGTVSDYPFTGQNVDTP